jgi:hypothetical protein
VWPTTLSGRLSIVALVGRYPTNKLIERGIIPERKLETEASFNHEIMRPMALCGISSPLELLSPTLEQISHALLTRSPLYLRRRVAP